MHDDGKRRVAALDGGDSAQGGVAVFERFGLARLLALQVHEEPREDEEYAGSAEGEVFVRLVRSLFDLFGDFFSVGLDLRLERCAGAFFIRGRVARHRHGSRARAP